jgi:hypothetical protein
MGATLPEDTMLQTTPVETTYLHKFEAAGLGKAPYRLVGFEEKRFQAAPGAPMQPGTCCDYCGTGIVDTFWLKSADGRTFKVGCDCVEKVSQKGDRVLSAVQKAANKMKREAAAKSLRKRLDRIYARLDADPAFLTDAPHPNGFAGKTLRDWAEWMFAHAGAAGSLKTVRILEKHLGE